MEDNDIFKGKMMDYKTAKETCHVRSGIRRANSKTVYPYNHRIPLDDRVPDIDKQFDDWEEFDPREQPNCAAFNETPA